MRILKFIFFLLPYLLFGDICLFTPPQNWQCSDPTKLSGYIKIGFIGKSKKLFKPTLNLAEEEIISTEEDYLSAVKKLHKENINADWKKIGRINTKSGPATLAEVDSKTKYGDVKILQAILVKDKHAYILTGAVLKEDFNLYYKDILNAMKSLTLTDDLFSLIADSSKKNALINKIDNIKNIKKLNQLEKYLKKEFASLGQYWQILLLKDAYISLHKK